MGTTAMHPADGDWGRRLSTAEVELTPAEKFPWAPYATVITLRRDFQVYSGLVYHPHLAMVRLVQDFWPAQGVVHVMDVGAGDGNEAAIFEFLGAHVFTINADPAPTYNASFFGDYLDARPDHSFDIVWCSHVLEHVRNPGAFLDKIFDELKMGGVLAISVPYNEFNSGPDTLTFGHHNRYNVPLLQYQLVNAGFDCSQAVWRVYNGQISLIVRKRATDSPRRSFGSDGNLSHFFSFTCHETGANVSTTAFNWDRFFEGGPLIEETFSDGRDDTPLTSSLRTHTWIPRRLRRVR